MIDLTKIEKPFGLLDEETRDALKVWPHGWERYGETGWRGGVPGWVESFTYRAKPAPLTTDSIDWSAVSPEYNYMTRNQGYEYGNLWIALPHPGNTCWHVLAGYPTPTKAHASYRRGTVNWRDSLVVRPGHN
jgi:hypothetical protein